MLFSSGLLFLLTCYCSMVVELTYYKATNNMQDESKCSPATTRGRESRRRYASTLSLSCPPS
ncbi:hypothetical protein PR003_g12894 [Phytophthora rubi]|uniref:Uncharacterized protein n=1 Tax=Phytophthora rubi TaxID=129364 RepID=A0A6A3M2D5_9STRA|nr:hypothetical protein PR002_g12423 [Phytophthora rubi]KAE9024618.1 hypothetical protein PR001_g12631 [Phytophthora rubi]KAE9335685.1 hypothetical protein PR003_g12894 [Phytophthora rubi]